MKFEKLHYKAASLGSLELPLRLEKFNLQLKKYLVNLLLYLLQMKFKKHHKELRNYLGILAVCCC